MSTTQPIRTTKDVKKLECYYKKDTLMDERNRLLIVMGLNTALRITDILNLQWKSVYDYEKKKLKTHIELVERKTGKSAMVVLNSVLRESLLHRFKGSYPEPDDYLFASSRGRKPIDRHQAYRIIRQAASQCGLSDHISCHSLRKTFGYHAWKQGIQPAVLMDIYNHSSYRITARYLCIDQDDRDAVFRHVQL